MRTTRFADEETGLYYCRARYYSPVTGRFLQRDPLGYALGAGPYEYVNSNAPNATDLRRRMGLHQPSDYLGGDREGELELNNRAMSDWDGGIGWYAAHVGRPPPIVLRTSVEACFKSKDAFCACYIALESAFTTLLKKWLQSAGQTKIVNKLVHMGGEVVKGGKGSHVKVKFPGGTLTIQQSKMPDGTANAVAKQILKVVCRK